jgi:hypothetical protein
VSDHELGFGFVCPLFRSKTERGGIKNSNILLLLLLLLRPLVCSGRERAPRLTSPIQ